MNSPYSQAVMWPGTTGAVASAPEFEKFIANDFDGTRAKVIGEFTTLPDFKDGEPVPNTGGRIDLVFAVHRDDIQKFAVARLKYGMRWVDDVIANEKLQGCKSIYCQEVHDLCSW